MIRSKFFLIILVMAALLLSGCGLENLGHEDSSAPVDFSEPAAPSAAELPQTEPAAPAETETAPPPETEAPTETAPPPETGAPAETKASVSSIPEGSKVIALTFDDGPDMRYTSSTSRILDVLEEYGARATFFVQGVQLTYEVPASEDGTGESFAERNKKILKRASDLGMEIGTHTFDHPRLLDISEDEIREQIRKSCQMIEEVTGQAPRVIRPPYGDAEQREMDLVDMPFIIWDVDTMDWDTLDPDNTVKVALEKAQPGSIILMHDIYNTTADAVEMLVPKLIDKGYTIVTVSEMFEYYGIPLENHHKYSCAR